jgi:carboxypeptidase Taq
MSSCNPQVFILRLPKYYLRTSEKEEYGMSHQDAPREYQKLLSLWAEIDDLRKVGAVLHWDEQTQMPKSGASARADHKATIERLAHARISSGELGALLEKLAPWAESLQADSDEAAIVRVARRGYEQATKISPELVMKMSQVRSESFRTWLQSREAKDFKVFRPALEKVYEVSREMAESIGYKEHPLDPVVDMREPGMTVADVETLFATLRETLVSLAKQIAGKGEENRDEMLRKYYDPKQQWDIGIEGVKAIGFKMDEGRADISVHPFSITFSPNDVRITTRIMPNDFGPSFFAFLHEAGHGHYMQGIPVKYRRTPLTEGASFGMHESQSRTWENIVGRSRGFSEFFYPRVQQVFPEQTKGYTVDDWYRAVNTVKPSFIRVEADEVTYNLHIMIRFELEKAVYDGKLAIADLRDAWNAKFEEYLGITPPDDLVGVLQDIHWSGGFGASFQSYTIGNVMSAQLYEAALRDVPGLEANFERGDFSGLLAWSQEKVHAHGSKYTPQELMKVATGQYLTAEPYLRYIKGKFGELYNL